MYLMASPPARGLFAKAIAQSAYMISTPELKTAVHGAPSAEQAGVTLDASAQGAPTSRRCARWTRRQITAAAAGFGYGPWGAVDGIVCPDQLVNVFDQGKQAHVPVLAGFNSGEIRSLTLARAARSCERRRVREQDPRALRRSRRRFPALYPSDNLKESIFATTRDALYGWTAERLARKQAALGLPSYLYLWDHGYPAADSAGLHAFHASELPYVFGTFDATPPLWPKNAHTPAEDALAEAMGDYWTSFARTGRPQAKHAPDWPAYAPDARYMHIAATPMPERNLMPGMYDLNEAVMCRRRAAGTVSWGWNVGLWAPRSRLPLRPGC